MIATGKSLLTDLTRTLIKKLISQSRIDQDMATGCLLLLPSQDALQLLERVVKGAGTKYKKLLVSKPAQC